MDRQVETEFRAQIGKLRQAGLRPTHLDTHKHVHCLPGVLAAMLAALGCDDVAAQLDEDES